MTLIERVARAIGGVYDGEADPVTTPNNWARAMDAAKVALDELNEPTLSMSMALFGQYPPGPFQRAMWVDMLKAALSESPTNPKEGE